MTSVLLFCTASEAVPLLKKVNNMRNYEAPQQKLPPLYLLVESKAFPDNGEGYKTHLNDSEAFHSEFIGSTEEECMAVALDEWHRNFIESQFIAIVDARSAVDETVVFKYYYVMGDLRTSEEIVEGPYFRDPKFGKLPPRHNCWYDWRVRYENVYQLYISLAFVPGHVTFPAFFGRKEQLTDEYGVFNVEKAHSYAMGHETESNDD